MYSSNPLFVITGAGQGFGLELVHSVNARGFRSILAGRSLPKAGDVDIDAYELDCANSIEAQAFWTGIKPNVLNDNHIILINNAGRYMKARTLDTDFDQLESTIRDNFYSAVTMATSFCSTFETGTIINIVSFSALGRPFYRSSPANKAAYASAKSAVATYFNTLRYELQGSKYRIVNLYPQSINPVSEPNASGGINPIDLANWVIDTSLLLTSFEIADCVILPFESGIQETS